jgi:tetratricopeptide (TPR) repeat protein
MENKETVIEEGWALLGDKSNNTLPPLAPNNNNSTPNQGVVYTDGRGGPQVYLLLLLFLSLPSFLHGPSCTFLPSPPSLLPSPSFLQCPSFLPSFPNVDGDNQTDIDGDNTQSQKLVQPQGPETDDGESMSTMPLAPLSQHIPQDLMLLQQSALSSGRGQSLQQPTTHDARILFMINLAHQQYSEGKYLEAQATCEGVYQTDAYHTNNLLLLGAIHFQLRNFSECIFYNQQCIRIDPHFAEAFGNLGNALKELGDLHSAIQFYLKAIKLKPRFCDAYNNLASAYMQMGDTKQAVETYRMALVLNPSLVDAHSNLGNLYKAQGRQEDAKKCYTEAIRIKPDFCIAWSNLAGVFKDEGDLSTAIAYYNESIRLCPEFADAHSNLGNANKESGNLDDAMKCYKRAINLRPDFAIAHGNLASCYYDKGDMDTAVKMFKHAIQVPCLPSFLSLSFLSLLPPPLPYHLASFPSFP